MLRNWLKTQKNSKEGSTTQTKVERREENSQEADWRNSPAAHRPRKESKGSASHPENI